MWVEGRLHGDGHGIAEVDHNESKRDEPLLAAEVHAPKHRGENRSIATSFKFCRSRFAPLRFLYLCLELEPLVVSERGRLIIQTGNWKDINGINVQ